MHCLVWEGIPARWNITQKSATTHKSNKVARWKIMSSVVVIRFYDIRFTHFRIGGEILSSPLPNNKKKLNDNSASTSVYFNFFKCFSRCLFLLYVPPVWAMSLYWFLDVWSFSLVCCYVFFFFLFVVMYSFSFDMLLCILFLLVCRYVFFFFWYVLLCCFVLFHRNSLSHAFICSRCSNTQHEKYTE